MGVEHELNRIAAYVALLDWLMFFNIVLSVYIIFEMRI